MSGMTQHTPSYCTTLLTSAHHQPWLLYNMLLASSQVIEPYSGHNKYFIQSPLRHGTATNNHAVTSPVQTNQDPDQGNHEVHVASHIHVTANFTHICVKLLISLNHLVDKFHFTLRPPPLLLHLSQPQSFQAPI